VIDVRGLGLLLAMELDRPAKFIVDGCLQRGFLINCIQDRILRFVPPLIISREEIDALIDCLEELLAAGDPES